MRSTVPSVLLAPSPRRTKRLVVGGLASGLASLGLVALPSSASAASFQDEGSRHVFVVPAGVTALTVDAVGGAGGNGPQAGGRAAQVQATLSVTPGQVVYVHVAANGGYQDAVDGAANGGGGSPTAGSGGGASDVRVGTDDLAHRVLVAGGGGGSGNTKQGAVGDAGLPGGDGLANYCAGAGSSAAQPGTSMAGGAGGNGCAVYGPGTAGTLGVGGQGAYSADGNVSGGGGGGGYFGGGGGNPYSGGAGGSSYVDPTATVVVSSLAPFESVPSVTFDSVVFGQSIGFTSSAPPSPVAGGSYLVSASNGGSSSPLTFSTDSASCTVADNDNDDDTATVHFTHLGVCFFFYYKACYEIYTAASETTQSMTVAQGSQDILLSPSPSNLVVGGSYLASATGGESPFPVAFSTGSSTCTVTDHHDSTATVNLVHVGGCVVTAVQAGNADFTAAAQQTQSVTIGKGAQSISFTSTNPGTAKVGSSYLVAATGGPSGIPVRFSSTATSCTVTTRANSTATVKVIHVGGCTVAADQAGNADYAAALRQVRSVTGVRATQGITFPALKRMRLHHADRALRATASSLLRVTYRTTTPKTCKLIKGKVHALRKGTCTVVASQAGTVDYYPAGKVKRSVKITR